MKNRARNLTAAALTACGAAGATAAQADIAPAVTRSQVQAERQAARDSGQMDALHGEDSGSFWLAGRQQRATSVDAARGGPAAALAAALVGEDSGSAHLSASAPPSGLTRSEVLAEARAAAQ